MAQSTILPTVKAILAFQPMRPKDMLDALDARKIPFRPGDNHNRRVQRLATILAGQVTSKVPTLKREDRGVYSLVQPPSQTSRPSTTTPSNGAPQHWQPKPALSPQAAFLTRNLLETPTIDRVIVEQELQIEGKQYLLVRCL
jgi:hypothetical protein